MTGQKKDSRPYRTMLLMSGDMGEDGSVRLWFYDAERSTMEFVDGGVFSPYFFTRERWRPPASMRVEQASYRLDEATRTNIFTGANMRLTRVTVRPKEFALLRAEASKAAAGQGEAGSGGGCGGNGEVWEGNIRHIDSYYYERGLVPGRFYNVYDADKGAPAAAAAGARARAGAVKAAETASPGNTGAVITPYTSDDEGGEANKAMLERLEKAIIPGLRADKSVIDADEYEARLRGMASTLSEPIPEFKRCAVDIEIDSGGRNPDPSVAEHTVTAVGLHSPDERVVFLLGGRGDNDSTSSTGNGNAGAGASGTATPRPTGGRERMIKPVAGGKDAGGDIRVVEFNTEEGVLRAAFDCMSKYPCILTYYGDEFDIPYMYNRAVKLGMDDEAGRAFVRRGSLMQPAGAAHIDLYKVFANPSLHAYAFAGKYNTFGLGPVSEAMLGEAKTGSGADASKMSPDELAAYCYNDARLTYGLSAFSDGIVMRLLVILARLSILSVDAVSRTRVSTWIQSAIRAEQRRIGALIPRFLDLQARAGGGTGGGDDDGGGAASTPTAQAVGADSDGHRTKKYKGATVLEQVAGVHWGLTVLDFASMYPAIIRSWNLSYETVRCDHGKCRETNRIPGTDHWHCTKRAGILASLIGAMREMRVSYYKPLARDKSVSRERRDVFSTIEQAIKVVMNASYGVMGSDMFAMYFLPVAESTTAVGRHIISDTVRMCEERGMSVLYGDTDSLFLGRAGQADLDAVIAGTKERHGADLEVDKQYRYAILTGRKKNYLGVRDDGTFDIKGLTGKKSHTPSFVRNCFDGAIARLARAVDDAGIEEAKAGIIEDTTGAVGALRAGDVPIRDLLFRVRMTQPMRHYGGGGGGNNNNNSSGGNGNGNGNGGGGGGQQRNHMLTGTGRAADPLSMDNLPQHVKAAMELHRKFDADIREGDVIAFVKSTRRSGVSPYECAAREDVAVDKYAEFLASTLDQLLRPLDIDIAAVIGGCHSKRMEEFFG